MPIENPSALSKQTAYLSNPVKGENKTGVFIEYDKGKLFSGNAALKHLQDHSPLVLRKLVIEEHLTTILLAWENPRIRIGKGPPKGDRLADISEIIEVLAANGVETRCTD